MFSDTFSTKARASRHWLAGGSALALGAVAAGAAALGGETAGYCALWGLAVASTCQSAARMFERAHADNQLSTIREELLGLENDLGADDALGAMKLASGDILPVITEKLEGIRRMARALQLDRSKSRELVERESSKRLQFLSGISHELRTPLNAVLGYSALLQGQVAAGQTGPTLAEDLQRIQDAGQNLLGLIDDLFILSGQDSARSFSRGGPIDIGALIAEVSAEYRASGQHNAGVVLDPATMVGDIMIGDRALVQRCLRHLLDHAALYCAGGQVQVAASAGEAGSGTIRITVSDNGPAPDPALLEILSKTVRDGEFMPDHAIPGGAPAGVVGLAMAHGLARSIHGGIEISSRGDGATDTGLLRILTLPLQGETSGKNAMTDTPTEPTNVTDFLAVRRAANPQQKVALIIDDDPSAVDLLARWMRRCGYHVLSANNADAGFAIALSENPDLVLLDALMPGHSGYELLPQMRSAPQLAATPIVLVTVDDDRERGLQAGASDFVRKPISEAELRHIISVYDTALCGDILVIEDDDDAAEIMCRNLARIGFSPRRAVDGAEGLEMLSAARPAAIVLDLNMPRLNGFEFIEALGLDCHAVPVVVVSGQDLSLLEHRKLMAAGCRFFLKGASAPREIAQTLREVVA